MSEVLSKQLTNVRICEALGLDPKKVQKVTITLGPDIWPKIVVETWLSIDTSGKVEPILKEYELREKTI